MIMILMMNMSVAQENFYTHDCMKSGRNFLRTLYVTHSVDVDTYSERLQSIVLIQRVKVRFPMMNNFLL